jgi:asparagine synthase (glutamine-hydrolysing)
MTRAGLPRPGRRWDRLGASARMLAGLTGVRPDPAWLAAALIDPGAAAHGARSPFEAITISPPGSRVCLRPGRPPAITSAAPLTRRLRPEAVAGLRRALDDGIAARVRAASRPSDLSGLDSGSVCMLAARHVRPAARLTAVTVHPAGRDQGGHLDCARAGMGPGSPVDHQLLPLGPGHLPGTALDQVPATDEPAPSTVTWARLAAEFALLARLGSDCHLTGTAGILCSTLDPDTWPASPGPAGCCAWQPTPRAGPACGRSARGRCSRRPFAVPPR